MRKLTVTLKPNFIMKKAIGSIFKRIEYIEMQELMKMDFSSGIKLGVAKVLVKKGSVLKKGKMDRKLEILDILEITGDKYTCMMKVNVPKSNQKLLRMFDFELIYDIPTIISLERLTYSVIGEEKNLRKFLKLLKLIGSVEKVIYKNADYRGIGISQALTEKQNNILNNAVDWGYYEYPRKISTDELAKRLKISRTTLVEHLRKAENRVMQKVFVK